MCVGEKKILISLITVKEKGKINQIFDCGNATE